jgi:uncharacterized protein YndB with AHSA1/START domain
MAADYHYISIWQLQAPIERVWAAISDLERLPGWYPAIQQVQTLTAGDPDGVGSRVRYLIKGRLPMRLAFEATIARVDPPRELVLRAEGDLAGTGRWELQQQDGVTTVRYLWDVQTTRPWMNLVAPVARPLVHLEQQRRDVAGRPKPGPPPRGAAGGRWLHCPGMADGPPAGMGGPSRVGRVVADPHGSSASTAWVMCATATPDQAVAGVDPGRLIARSSQLRSS